jgi:DNA-binding response OmpR family regulator
MTRILLLEPDKLLAKTYRQALLHAGYEVLHATSGQDAIDIADEHTPDLIILELQLPAHNGLEFLYEFRSYGEWQRIPILVNTVIPQQHLGFVNDIIHNELGVQEWYYKPQTNLQTLLRGVNVQLLNL